MTLIHDTFTLDRTYDAAVAEVWRAWTDPELRPRWFHGPEGWDLLERTLDLRVGGGELLRGRMPNGTETRFASTFHVIVPDHHIVSAYDMHVGGAQMSVTLATLDLEAAKASTRLRYTEQGVYFDGNPESPANRKRGTSWHLDNLAKLF
jgi:uncharacterized protein YndB with AHSA1/START domain